jgi:hypothetical protein
MKYMKNVEKLSLEQKSKIFQEKLEEIKKELNVEVQINIDFPEFKILPADIQLALLVISKHTSNFSLTLKENK